MKKLFLILFTILLIILFIFGIKLYIDMYNTGRSVTLIGVDKGKITDYIISLYEPYKGTNENFKTFVAIKDIKIKIKENEVVFYTWILTESYCEKNGKIELVTSSSMPYKFTLNNAEIVKCEYSSFDDYSIFPEDVKEQFSNIDNIELKSEIKRQIIIYYHKNYNLDINNIINDIENNMYINVSL